ncbi:AfsR/SARP family transcriptional regulator [Nakamurella lactea]|uniref:AfsR/SARP family transcriptional regulator n=1 Tax=Nakamurella lactea TaxID=459515 RepID=UPI0004000C6F|nr:AfsR/SARP family transcriptional regulator [Nakamurella lactea]
MTADRVLIGVLGQLMVTRDGADVPIASAKQRVLLAVLLAHPDGPVAVDRLVEILWPGRRPASARANVQTFVHRLRGHLGAETIVSHPGGYQWNGDPGGSDAALFEQAVTAGRAARENGDLPRAADDYRSGLILWRGNAFDGLRDVGPLTVEAARLDELRLVALQECYDCELALDRHRALIPELLALVADHPLQEHFLAQAMTALHGAGRSSDALELYRTARRQLASEIGVEPGRAVRALQQSILAQTAGPAGAAAGGGAAPDGAADAPADSADTPRTAESVGPAQLPAAPAAFIGRDEDVEDLVAALLTGGQAPGLAIVTGPGGVGKSALALHTAHRLTDHFPDGQLYLDLRGATPGMTPLEPNEALSRLVRALAPAVQLPPGPIDEVAARFRSLLAGRRILLLLDDATDAAQVRPLLPGSATCAVLITSRRPLPTLDGAHRRRIGELSAGQAVQLLGALVGDGRVASEPSAAAEVVNWCDRLPLAICLAGAKLAGRPHWTVETLRGRLAGDDQRLDEFEIEDRGVRRSFALSSAELSPTGAELFALLGTLPIPEVGVPLVAALAETTEWPAQCLLDELVDAQLIQPVAGGRYRLHDLLRLFARERAQSGRPAVDVPAALRKILHLYLATAIGATAHLQERNPWKWRHLPTTLSSDPVAFADAAAARSWYSAELPAMVDVAAMAATVSAELAALVIALATAQRPMLQALGHWREALALAGSMQIAARTTGDPTHRAQADQELAVLLCFTGHPADGLEHGRRALAAWRRGGDRVGEAHGLMAVASALRGLDRHDELLTVIEQSLVLRRESGDRSGEVGVLIELGLCHLRRGDLAAARTANLQAEATAKKFDLGRKLAVTTGNLAEIDRRAADLDAAIAGFERALQIDRAEGLADSVFVAEHLWGLGRALQQRADERRSTARPDDLERARTCWHRSAGVLAAVGLITEDERREITATPAPRMPQALELAF